MRAHRTVFAAIAAVGAVTLDLAVSAMSARVAGKPPADRQE